MCSEDIQLCTEGIVIELVQKFVHDLDMQIWGSQGS